MKIIKFALVLLTLSLSFAAFGNACGNIKLDDGLLDGERSICSISESVIKQIKSTKDRQAVAKAFNKQRSSCVCEGDTGQDDGDESSSHCSSPRSIKVDSEGNVEADYKASSTTDA